MVDQLVHHRDQLGQHLGEGRDYCGHWHVGKHHWTCWHHIYFSCMMAAKCLVAILFKRISHMHMIVNMRWALLRYWNVARKDTSHQKAALKSSRIGDITLLWTSWDINSGVSILLSYGENPHYVKLPIISEFMENSTKFMKNSGLIKWTQTLC